MSSPAGAEIARALYQAEMLRRAVVDLASIADQEGVPLLAFKGVHLAFAVAEDPLHRSFCDADVLVPSDSRRFIDAAIRGGFRRGRPSLLGYELFREPGVVIDVHTRVLPPGFGRLRLRSLFERSTTHPSLGRARLPDTADAAVIAVAHAVKDGLRRDPRADLEALAQKSNLTPTAFRDRLREHRLLRAGRIALLDLAEREEGFRPWLEALGSTGGVTGTTPLHRALKYAAQSEPRALLVIAPLATDGLIAPLVGALIGSARAARAFARDVYSPHRRFK